MNLSKNYFKRIFNLFARQFFRLLCFKPQVSMGEGGNFSPPPSFAMNKNKP